MLRDTLHPAMQRPARKTWETSCVMVAQPSEARAADDWRWLPRLDLRPGNPCIGIAVACALSLPFWAALSLLLYLAV
jgi:hypothetical protein